MLVVSTPSVISGEPFAVTIALLSLKNCEFQNPTECKTSGDNMFRVAPESTSSLTALPFTNAYKNMPASPTLLVTPDLSAELFVFGLLDLGIPFFDGLLSELFALSNDFRYFKHLALTCSFRLQ